MPKPDAPASPALAEEAAPSITLLLHSWSGGDPTALDRLIPLVYDELRRLARRQMRQERDAHTLQSTGLVHEAFLRLAQQRGVNWVSRAHFYGWAAQLMRRILVDHARSRNAAKRGGGKRLQSLDQLEQNPAHSDEPASTDAFLDILHLDLALQRMERLDARQSRVVELRFFGGLSVEETAEVLVLSPATVKREWATARAWLLNELTLTPHGLDGV